MDGSNVRLNGLKFGGIFPFDYFLWICLSRLYFSRFVRQISTGSVDGPLEVKLRAMLDRLFSHLANYTYSLDVLT